MILYRLSTISQPNRHIQILQIQDVSGSGMPDPVEGLYISLRRPERHILAHTHLPTILTSFGFFYGIDNISVLHFTLYPQYYPQSVYKTSTASEEVPIQRECPGIDVPGQLVNNW